MCINIFFGILLFAVLSCDLYPSIFLSIKLVVFCLLNSSSLSLSYSKNFTLFKSLHLVIAVNPFRIVSYQQMVTINNCYFFINTATLCWMAGREQANIKSFSEVWSTNMAWLLWRSYLYFTSSQQHTMLVLWTSENGRVGQMVVPVTILHVRLLSGSSCLKIGFSQTQCIFILFTMQILPQTV